MSKRNFICLDCEKPSEECICGNETYLGAIAEVNKPPAEFFHDVIRSHLQRLKAPLPVKMKPNQILDRFVALEKIILALLELL